MKTVRNNLGSFTADCQRQKPLNIGKHGVMAEGEGFIALDSFQGESPGVVSGGRIIHTVSVKVSIETHVVLWPLCRSAK